MRIIIFLLVICCFLNSYGQKTISSQKLLEDFDYLIEELKLQHQGLYQYVDKEVVNAQLDSIRNTLDVPLSTLEFYKKISYTITLTNEGHSYADLPKRTMLKVGLSKSFLPLTVKFCDRELIITQNYGEDIPGLTKGAKLLSVNGKSIEKLLEKFFPLMVTDGFNETSKYKWIGGRNFSRLYRLVIGKQEYFDLDIQEYGSVEVKRIKIPAIRYKTFKRKNAKFKPKKFDYTAFAFKVINDSIAYMSVPGFGKNIDYAAFYKSNFRAIDSLNIKHLILDIQANGGGTEGNENLLFSYFTDTAVQKYRNVTMLPKPYDKNKKSKGLILDKWSIKTLPAMRGNFTLFSDYYSDLGYTKPLERLIFKGKLYTLISGFTFSGGAEFASLLKMTDRGIFIGEETGGTYEGNVSGYSEKVKLPNSKIKVNIPTVHFQINVSPDTRGRGVMPDYTVPQTWEDYMKGNNSKLDFAIKLIMH